MQRAVTRVKVRGIVWDQMVRLAMQNRIVTCLVNCGLHQIFRRKAEEFKVAICSCNP